VFFTRSSKLPENPSIMPVSFAQASITLIFFRKCTILVASVSGSKYCLSLYVIYWVKVRSHYHCSEKFSGGNPVMKIRNLDHVKIFRWICHADQQIAAWFESDFCVSSASLITILLTMDNKPVYAKGISAIRTAGDCTFRLENLDLALFPWFRKQHYIKHIATC